MYIACVGYWWVGKPTAGPSETVLDDLESEGSPTVHCRVWLDSVFDTA